MSTENEKMRQQLVALETDDLQQRYMELMSENEDLVLQKLEALQGRSSLEKQVSDMNLRIASLNAQLVQARVEDGVLQEVSQVR